MPQVKIASLYPRQNKMIIATNCLNFSIGELIKDISIPREDVSVSLL